MDPTSLKLRGTRKHEGKTSDNELLFLSLQNPKVFGQIVDRYQRAFISKAKSIIGNEEDAQDVVQETFTKIYLHAGKFERRAGATFNSWAYKILLNTCFSHHKKYQKEKRDLSYDDSIELREEEYEEESKMDKFILTLSKIPEGAARLLRMMVVEGKSHKDISEIEGVSEGAVRVRVHRAKETFKKALVQNQNL